MPIRADVWALSHGVRTRRLEKTDDDTSDAGMSDVVNTNVVCDRIQSHFDRHVPGDGVEVEFRLGRFNGNYFDTNVGRAVFEKVVGALTRYEGWERVNTWDADVYYNDAQRTRLTIDTGTGEQVAIQKTKLAQEDFLEFSEAPFDIRFAISRENPVPNYDPSNHPMDRRRTKSRTSFVRKNLSIDATVSTGDPVDKDAEHDVSYQLELEIIDPSEVGCTEELFNMVYKINDLFRVIK
jgi:hypothetical protein